MYLCIYDNRHLSLLLSAIGQFQLKTRFSNNIVSSSSNYVENTKTLISCAGVTGKEKERSLTANRTQGLLLTVRAFKNLYGL